jgi:hypothetical protein
MPWGYSDSDYAERWNGAGATREDAIAEGREAYPGKGFWIAEGTTPEPGFFFPDADDLIETAGERAADEIGEASEDWPPNVPKDALAELSVFIVAWANKHCPCEFWMQDGRKEFIEALPSEGATPGDQ